MHCHLLIIISVFLSGFLFDGCSSKMPVKPQCFTVKLSNQIPEPFSFKINDKTTKKLISDLRTDNLKTAQRIEIVSLQELCTVNEPKDVPLIYDRLWESVPEINNLVNASEIEPEYANAAALVYYLLVADDMPSWREKTAASVKKHGWKNFNPEQLTGYPLHFYTLALLKTGQFEAALPFLSRMKNFTQPDIYLMDLQVALDFACTAQNAEYSRIFIEKICDHTQTHQLDIPDAQIKMALMRINKKESLKEINLGLGLFYEKLKNFENLAFVIFLENLTGMTPNQLTTVQNPSLRKSSQKMTPQKIMAGINIQMIEAGNGSSFIDPKLKSIADQLQDTFVYSEYRLSDEHTLVLCQGEKETIKTSNDFLISVEPIFISKEKINLTLTIENNEEIVTASVYSINGGENFLGGPRENGKRIVLHMSTWIKDRLK